MTLVSCALFKTAPATSSGCFCFFHVEDDMATTRRRQYDYKTALGPQRPWSRQEGEVGGLAESEYARSGLRK